MILDYFHGGYMSNILKTMTVTILTIACISGCTWDNRDTGTAVGAVAGGLAGSALTGGSTAGTIAGAVGGGVIGNQMSR